VDKQLNSNYKGTQILFEKIKTKPVASSRMENAWTARYPSSSQRVQSPRIEKEQD
jgi:hypothetical protein